MRRGVGGYRLVECCVLDPAECLSSVEFHARHRYSSILVGGFEDNVIAVAVISKG